MRQQYEPSADRIIALYQQLEDDILSAVIRRILKMGYVSEASKHQLEVLQAAGLLYDDIVQLIADRTDACTAQVKALFEDAGVQTVSIDNSLHEAAGALPIDIRQDSSTRQVLEAGYKKTLGTMRNLVSTTATQTQTAFIQTCDRIYMQVSSGAFSYQEAIMNALRALSGYRSRSCLSNQTQRPHGCCCSAVRADGCQPDSGSGFFTTSRRCRLLSHGNHRPQRSKT